MTTATVFGTGNMGSAITTILHANNIEVEQINTSSSNSTINGDIVVLAVPYSAFASIVTTHGAQLTKKLIVDVSNPVDFETFQLAVPSASSAAAELATALPKARVIKAFNTNFAQSLATKKVGQNPTSVLLAGDDTDAKASLANIIETGGLTAIDAGALTAARELEAIGYLQLQLAINQRISFSGGFSVTK